MDPVTMALAGGSIGTSLLGMGMQYNAQRETNDMNVGLTRESNTMAQSNAREQMGFQQFMSDTAHQREVADLKAAGLNPLLSVNAGSSTPSGAAGSTSAPQVRSPMEGFSNSANSIARNMQDLVLGSQKQKAEISLMNAQAAKTAVDAKVNAGDVPESDFKTKMYNWVSKQFGDLTKTNAKSDVLSDSDKQKIKDTIEKDRLNRIRKQQNDRFFKQHPLSYSP